MVIAQAEQDSLDFLTDVGRSISRIPFNLFDGVKEISKMSGIEGKRNFLQAWRTNTRFAELVLQLLKTPFTKHGPILQIVFIVTKEYFKHFPDQVLVAAAKKAGIIISERASKALILNELADAVTIGIVWACGINMALKKTIRTIIGSTLLIVMIEGAIERAERASQQLKATCPAIYHQLRIRNLDLGYFLVEKPLKKYIEAYNRAG